jgi:sphinganine-1-phosphate aldolase
MANMLTAVRRNYRSVSYHVQTLRNLFTLFTVLRITLMLVTRLRMYGIRGTAIRSYTFIRRIAFTAFLNLPGVKQKVQKQVADALVKLDEQMLPKAGVVRYQHLPEKGLSKEQIQKELKTLHELGNTTDWQGGKVSGAIYHGGKELSDLLSEAHSMFSLSNPLHPDVFPGVRKMESEVVAMCLSMFHAPSSGGGTTTSGGTESILMACKAARDYGRLKKGIKKPEMVVPVTIHAAFDKAAQYFGIQLHHIEVDPVTYQVDLKKVERFINSNTILIAGSAPNFPHGIIDDITGLSALAVKYNIPLHVDCCLGSVLVPFLERAGFYAPLFDFRLPGVTSISADGHKYFFAPKGTSFIMYRDRAMRKHQYFIQTNWPGGVYASPSIAGSRPGAIIAGCWTAMMSMGENGYLQSCREIVGARAKIQSRIESEIPELKILGRPCVSVVSFTSDVLNIYSVGDKMSKAGWHLNGLQNPPALHIACTRLSSTNSAVDTLIADLKRAVAEVVAEGGGGDAGSMAMLYGAGALPDKSIVASLAEGFLDTLYKA